MRLRALSLLGFMVFCCNEVPEFHIQYLEGYWEIKEVILPDGNIKIYGFNDTVDYIHISDSSGFRKKLKPNLRGGFLDTGVSEKFEIKWENDSLNIHYTTPFANWKETVFSITVDELLIINHDKVRYLYKRYKPLNHDNGQTPQ